MGVKLSILLPLPPRFKCQQLLITLVFLFCSPGGVSVKGLPLKNSEEAQWKMSLSALSNRLLKSVLVDGDRKQGGGVGSRCEGMAFSRLGLMTFKKSQYFIFQIYLLCVQLLVGNKKGGTENPRILTKWKCLKTHPVLQVGCRHLRWNP